MKSETGLTYRAQYRARYRVQDAEAAARGPGNAGVAAGQAQGATDADRETKLIVTRRKVAAVPERVWRSLMFYEQIDVPPPWLLRLLLPLPIRTEGSKAAVGDQATCLYQGGHLLKRVLHIDPGRYYEFAVVEQQLDFGGDLRLAGGSYSLRALARSATEIAISTRYSGGRRPRLLWGPVEAVVCHRFHQHLLRSIGEKACAS